MAIAVSEAPKCPGFIVLSSLKRAALGWLSMPRSGNLGESSASLPWCVPRFPSALALPFSHLVPCRCLFTPRVARESHHSLPPSLHPPFTHLVIMHAPALKPSRVPSFILSHMHTIDAVHHHPMTRRLTIARHPTTIVSQPSKISTDPMMANFASDAAQKVYNRRTRVQHSHPRPPAHARTVFTPDMHHILV